MTRPPLPPTPGEGLEVVGFEPGDEARLQAFFDENPAYFEAVMGGPAGPDEAREDMTETPPADMPWREILRFGWAGPDGRLEAYANVTIDLLAERVWHLGLFIVATRHHGSGLAPRLCDSLHAWARAHGAQWMRLGVVVGNARAERFWARQGYSEIKRRHGLVFGRLTHSVRVMLKPLGDEALAQYLERVPRDRPDPA